jgi:PPOX class probable F420-dependent enzyme
LIYSAIDEKPKRTSPPGLRRISNITENPMVCVVVDDYSENWQKLDYILIDGRADILVEGEEFAAALVLLREKYPQYVLMRLENRPLIRVTPLRITAWTGALPGDSKTVKPKT